MHNSDHFRPSNRLLIVIAALLTAGLLTGTYVPVLASDAQQQAQQDQQAQDQPTQPFRYEHDPQDNPDAMKDIVVNPDAVYGFSPDPDSKRLGSYADALDWTDPAQVAAARETRAAYHEEMSQLYRLIEDMLGQGKNVEEIARAVSRKRNEIRLASYDGDPEGLARVKKSNLDTYGNEEGPTADSLYEKYGSWQTVLEKALSSSPGMDACLGFYDEYYDTYDYSYRAAENTTDAGEDQKADKDNADPVSDAETAAPSDTYVVQRGDCLWSIAESRLGDGHRWNEIYEKNRSSIADPSLIYPGQELVMP